MPTKIFLPPPLPNQPSSLSSTKARTCAVINQLACPGLGTIMAGRRAGYLQAVLMVTGFVLTMGFMGCYFSSLVSFMVNSGGGEPNYREMVRPYAWAGLSGLGCCAVAWLWAGVSTISILRQARQGVAKQAG